MNKKIVLAIGFLIFLTGGILAWQYFEMPPERVEVPKEIAPEEVVSPAEEEVKVQEKITEIADRKTYLLGKMFPEYEAKDGRIKILKDELVDVGIFIKHFPIFLDENKILLIAGMTGVPHFYGGYRAFLAVFDSKGNLLTSPFSIPKPTDIGGLVYSLDNLRKEDGAFAEKGDGQFSFYNCKETKYILFTGKFCVVGQCMEEASLHKIEGGKFRTVQEFIQQPETESMMVTPGEDKIRIYRFKQVPLAEDFICPPVKCVDWIGSPIEIGTVEGPENIHLFEKDLIWNNIKCRFE